LGGLIGRHKLGREEKYFYFLPLMEPRWANI